MWKKKYQKLKNAVESKEKVNIGKKLQKEKEQMNNEIFEGSISIKKNEFYLQQVKITNKHPFLFKTIKSL